MRNEQIKCRCTWSRLNSAKLAAWWAYTYDEGGTDILHWYLLSCIGIPIHKPEPGEAERQRRPREYVDLVFKVSYGNMLCMGSPMVQIDTLPRRPHRREPARPDDDEAARAEAADLCVCEPGRARAHSLQWPWAVKPLTSEQLFFIRGDPYQVERPAGK